MSLQASLELCQQGNVRLMQENAELKEQLTTLKQVIKLATEAVAGASHRCEY